MAPRRVVVVVNPKSQNGALGRRWTYIAWDLRRILGSFDDVLTRAPGDATRLAREALAGGADCVVAIGGDGTLNEVANGFFNGDGKPVSTDAALAFLPFGTGGDFRKTANIPLEVARAATVIKAGRRRAIDVGKIEFTDHAGKPATRLFVNIASFGISGLVDEYVNTPLQAMGFDLPLKALGSRASFMIATARASLEYQNQRVRMVFDGDEKHGVELNVNTVAVANGRYFGGGMFVAPKAELDDGVFDMVTLGDMDMKDMLKDGYRLYLGTHLGLPKVSHRRGRELRATPLCANPVRLDCDGEAPGVLPATFTMLPGALTLMVPR
jgi:YegS/Rv2252/BmrU family lipid kinase